MKQQKKREVIRVVIKNVPVLYSTLGSPDKYEKYGVLVEMTPEAVAEVEKVVDPIINKLVKLAAIKDYDEKEADVPRMKYPIQEQDGGLILRANMSAFKKVYDKDEKGEIKRGSDKKAIVLEKRLIEPMVVDTRGNRIPHNIVSTIGRGSLVDLSLEVRPVEKSPSGVGVGIDLKGVRLRKLEKYTGSPSAESLGFDTDEDGYVYDESEAAEITHETHEAETDVLV